MEPKTLLHQILDFQPQAIATQPQTGKPLLFQILDCEAPAEVVAELEQAVIDCETNCDCNGANRGSCHWCETLNALLAGSPDQPLPF